MTSAPTASLAAAVGKSAGENTSSVFLPPNYNINLVAIRSNKSNDNSHILTIEFSHTGDEQYEFKIMKEEFGDLNPIFIDIAHTFKHFDIKKLRDIMKKIIKQVNPTLEIIKTDNELDNLIRNKKQETNNNSVLKIDKFRNPSLQDPIIKENEDGSLDVTLVITYIKTDQIKLKLTEEQLNNETILDKELNNFKNVFDISQLTRIKKHITQIQRRRSSNRKLGKRYRGEPYTKGGYRKSKNKNTKNRKTKKQKSKKKKSRNKKSKNTKSKNKKFKNKNTKKKNKKI